MKTFLLQILHYLWIRKDNIYSLYKKVKNNKNIEFDGKVSFNEFQEYIELYKSSGIDLEQNKIDDENIMTGSILNDKILENSSKRLIINQQKGVECVPTSLIRMINYNTSVIIDDNLKDKYIAELYRLKILVRKQGSSVQKVADFLRKKIMQDFGIELVYFKAEYGTKKYNDLLEKSYAHGMGGGISLKYKKDFKDNGIIDISKFTFKEKILYYHLFMNLPEEEAKKRGGNIVENYNIFYGIRNIYTNNHIDRFADKGVFFKYGYFFIEKININDKKFEEAKKSVGEYRKIAGKSVINNMKNLVNKFSFIKDEKEADELVALMEIVDDRKKD